MVSLSVEKEISDDFRVTYGIKADDSGIIQAMEMPENDIILRIGVRRGTGATLVQDIKFTKTKDKNHAWYEGKITVPTDGTGDYQIVAFLKEDANGLKYLNTSKEFTTPQVVGAKEGGLSNIPFLGIKSGGLKNEINAIVAKDGKITAHIPYTSKWQDLRVTEDRAKTTTLKLRPLGTLMRMRIHNATDAPQTFHQIKLVSNAFYIGVNLYLDGEHNGYPSISVEPYETQTLLIPDGGVTVQPNQYSQWLYHWVMPRMSEKADAYTVASVTTVAENPSISDYSKAFSTATPLSHGAVPVTLTYNGKSETQLEELPESSDQTETYRSPLDFFADAVLNKSKTGFVRGLNPENTNVGFFTTEEIESFTSPFTINGVEWRIPTRDEMASLLPVEFDKMGYGATKFMANNTTNDVLEESIKIGNVTQSYYADYKNENNILYGVRFKNRSNKYRTAFRYQVVEDPRTQHPCLEISTYYLGNESAGLREISTEQFWEVTNLVGKVTTKKYALYGYWSINGTKPTGVRQLCDLATSTSYETGARYIGLLREVGRSRVMTRSRAYKSVILPIRSL